MFTVCDYSMLHIKRVHQMYHIALLAVCSIVFNSRIAENSIVLGFSGKPLELLNIEKVKRYRIHDVCRTTLVNDN